MITSILESLLQSVTSTALLSESDSRIRELQRLAQEGDASDITRYRIALSRSGNHEGSKAWLMVKLAYHEVRSQLVELSDQMTHLNQGQGPTTGEHAISKKARARILKFTKVAEGHLGQTVKQIDKIFNGLLSRPVLRDAINDIADAMDAGLTQVKKAFMRLRQYLHRQGATRLLTMWEMRRIRAVNAGRLSMPMLLRKYGDTPAIRVLAKAVSHFGRVTGSAYSARSVEFLEEALKIIWAFQSALEFQAMALAPEGLQFTVAAAELNTVRLPLQRSIKKQRVAYDDLRDAGIEMTRIADWADGDYDFHQGDMLAFRNLIKGYNHVLKNLLITAKSRGGRL